MHIAVQGSIRISASVPDIGLVYTSIHHRPVVSLSLPPASAKIKHIVYTVEPTAIYPNVRGISHDPRFDGFRRNWLNNLQLNPSVLALANNTSSTSCAFCYYEYGNIAAPRRR